MAAWHQFNRQVSRSKSRFAFSHSTRNCLVTFWPQGIKKVEPFSTSQHLKMSSLIIKHWPSLTCLMRKDLKHPTVSWVCHGEIGCKDRLQEIGNEIKFFAENGRPPGRFRTKENVKCKSITLSVPLFLVCAFQKYESCTLLLGLIARQQFESTDPGAVWINCNFRRKKWHNFLKQAPSGHHLVQNLLKFAPAWTEHISHLAFPASRCVFNCALEESPYTFNFQKDLPAPILQGGIMHLITPCLRTNLVVHRTTELLDINASSV